MHVYLSFSIRIMDIHILKEFEYLFSSWQEEIELHLKFHHLVALELTQILCTHLVSQGTRTACPRCSSRCDFCHHNSFL